MNKNRRFSRWLSTSVKITAVLAAMGLASPALASHFRGGSIAWQALALDGDGVVNDVRITMKTAWRSDFVSSPSLDFTPTGPTETQISNDIIFVGGAEIEADSDYAFQTTIWEVRNLTVTTQYLVSYASGNRITTLQNNANLGWDIQTQILLENGNQAPNLEFPIIYEVPQQNTDGSVLTNWTFDVNALDPNADSVQYRLATAAELGDASATNATGLSIDADTGLMTWSGSGTRTVGLYSAGIVVEDLDATGAIKSKSHVDFILDLRAGSAVDFDPPSNVSDSRTVIVEKGSTFSFSISGSSISTVSLGDAQGALTETSPDNYTFDAGAVGNPVDPGVYPITFEIDDTTGSNTKSYYTINFVVPDPDAPVVANVADDRTVFTTAGTPVFIDNGQDATVTDTNNTDFDGGRLVLNITNSDYSNETLAVNSVGTGAGEISVSGSSVSYEGNVIGTIDSTLNGVNDILEIDLSSANATPEAVQALIRQLTYVNSSVTEDRDLSLYLEDPDGLSNFYNMFIQVPSTSQSDVSAAPSTRPANGTATSTVTVQLKDSTGKNLTESGGTVTMSTTTGTLSGVTDNGDGTYTATLTAPVSAGTATISATINGSGITDTAEVTFVSPGDGPNSTVSASPASVSTDVGTSTVTVQAVDSSGTPLTVGGDVVTISSTLGTVGPVTDNGDGTYSAAVTSSNSGTATVSATVNGAAASNTDTVTFTPGAANGGNSTLSAASTSITT
ncbi:Ig-like domain-containing protein, partial [Sessilibacter corallicola]|uniref:Ig-like domain-containing protein n=1 Tax=Sessilibacter corallicola TaxID=2904075 RepID=UPI00333F12B3